MNMLIAPGEGYIPEYTQTGLTDKLHDTFGFRTDYEIVSQREIKKDCNCNEKVEILLEFKKKTRAHKWRNYTVYGLLTLSQLSKTIFITKKDSLRKDSSLFFQKYHFTLLSEISIYRNLYFLLYGKIFWGIALSLLKSYIQKTCLFFCFRIGKGCLKEFLCFV